MTQPQAGGKWIAGLTPDMPVAEAAALVLEPRLEAVVELLHAGAGNARGRSSGDATQRQARQIHQLRVATRRSGAAIRFFRDALKKKHATQCRALLRDIRKAAGQVRSIDVDRAVLNGLVAGTADPFDLEPLNDAERLAISQAASLLDDQRKHALIELSEARTHHTDEDLRYRFGKLLMSIHDPGHADRAPGRGRRRGEDREPIQRLDQLAALVLPGLLEPLRDAAGRADLSLEQLHELRLACKQARYAIEICWPIFVPQRTNRKSSSKARAPWQVLEQGVYGELASLQNKLGLLNDGHELAQRLSGIAGSVREQAPSTHEALTGLVERAQRRLESQRQSFLDWWASDGLARSYIERAIEVAARPLDPAVEREPRREGASMPVRKSASASSKASAAPSPEAASITSMDTLIAEPIPVDSSSDAVARVHPGESKRIAAIDVGTNSIRLVVAEARPDGWFRILDDEKAVTRLGKGLAHRCAMLPETIALSAQAIARMRTIADGYGVEKIRLIGTAAARDASNGHELIHAIREAAGLEMEVISPAEEARLAVRSVDHAFHLENLHAAVVDIGGGSTELVLTANGLIDRVFPLKLGAVRLTEQFGTCEPGAPSTDELGYKAMRAYVQSVLRDEIGRLDYAPQTLFGTGGIFTSLASISMNGSIDRPIDPSKPRAETPAGAMLPFKIRGYELRRSEVKHILDRVRKLSVRDRARVPGMSPDRAEIAVAGLTIVESVMKHLGINTVRVHDRGIREGLILEMIDELFDLAPQSIVSPEKLDRITAAKRFAAACHYEAAHAHHVAELATSLFDQTVEALGAQHEPWATSVCRELVTAAALLHDVGYLINYSKHHKHSYHLIRHSDMPGFTPRELEIVANIARYHRRAEPKRKHPNFARLSEDDRRIMCKLAGITRLADGLVRSHTRNVRRTELAVADGEARITLIAGSDPSVDLWGGQRKASLYESEFGLKVVFDWRLDDAPQPEPVAGGVAAGTASADESMLNFNG